MSQSEQRKIRNAGALVGSRPLDGASAAEQKILALLRHQQSLYQELSGLTKKQRMMIQQGTTDSLMKILADRQRVTRGLEEVSGRLRPIRDQWSIYRERLCESTRHEAERLISESHGHLEEIMRSDAEDARLLAAQKSVVATELDQSRTQRDAMSAYRGVRIVDDTVSYDEQEGVSA